MSPHESLHIDPAGGDGMTSDRQAAIRLMVRARGTREWCLFLDRDGVINRQIVGDYVRDWADFDWLPNALPALVALRQWAPHLVVVTNQQGIGKGLMTAQDVKAIHQNVQAAISLEGMAIDDFRVCPHLESVNCSCRKPRAQLVLDWLSEHPYVDPSLSIMVGDSATDIELARNVAEVTGHCAGIRIGEEPSDVDKLADASFNSLWDFASAVTSARGERA